MTVQHCLERAEHLPHCEYCATRNRYYVCAGIPRRTVVDIDRASVCREWHGHVPRG